MELLYFSINATVISARFLSRRPHDELIAARVLGSESADRQSLSPLIGINFSIDRRRLGNPGHGEFRIFAIRQRSGLCRCQEGCGEESFEGL